MSHLLSCPSCGLFGWRRSQRRWEARLIAAAYRHLDHAIAGGENAPSGPQSA